MRRREGFWFLRPAGKRPNVIINALRNKIVIEQYTMDDDVVLMHLSRSDARMLAKRLNQALDATTMKASRRKLG